VVRLVAARHCLLAFDFCYYWFHRCSHEISILWAAHAVHHQSEDYNLSTALRQTSTGFLFNWIFYLPLFILGMPLEVFVTANAIDLIYQFWVHTQHIHKLGWLDRIFVTPSNHRVHHAQNQIYIDRNYRKLESLLGQCAGLRLPVVRRCSYAELERQTRHLVSANRMETRRCRGTIPEKD
jgi:sterol desaturase/sphingolipid hydroxylase (fatty acid hydroxylase superfamily)